MVCAHLHNMVIHLLYRYCIVGMNRRITEENEQSISLNDNTVFIQDYNNLDYSDEYQSGGSSDDHSLSRYHQGQLHKVQEVSRISKKQFLQSYLHQHEKKKKKQNHSVKRSTNLESKYDFGASPSTKEEYSLLNPHPRLSNQSNREAVLRSKKGNRQIEMPSLQEEPSQKSDQNYFYQHEVPQYSKQKKNSAKINNHNQSSHFDIDSFLNAHPVPLKNKKGVSVLAQSKQQKPTEKYRIHPKDIIKEEESIVLMTLPENQSINSKISYDQRHLEKALSKNEQQLQHLNHTYERRLKDVRLNFINTFLPQPLKPKNNAYNLLKYISNKHQF